MYLHACTHPLTPTPGTRATAERTYYLLSYRTHAYENPPALQGAYLPYYIGAASPDETTPIPLSMIFLGFWARVNWDAAGNPGSWTMSDQMALIVRREAEGAIYQVAAPSENSPWRTHRYRWAVPPVWTHTAMLVPQAHFEVFSNWKAREISTYFDPAWQHIYRPRSYAPHNIGNQRGVILNFPFDERFRGLFPRIGRDAPQDGMPRLPMFAHHEILSGGPRIAKHAWAWYSTRLAAAMDQYERRVHPTAISRASASMPERATDEQIAQSESWMRAALIMEGTDLLEQADTIAAAIYAKYLAPGAERPASHGEAIAWATLTTRAAVIRQRMRAMLLGTGEGVTPDVS